MSAIGLATKLQARGFVLRVVEGSLRVTPKSALTAADREAIRADLLALIASLRMQSKAGERLEPIKEHLRGEAYGEPWDSREAIRMMACADAVVDRLGVDGRNPEIIQAVARVAAAYAMRDLETVRFACSELEAAARRLASGPTKKHERGG